MRSFLSKTFVERKIGDNLVKFYSCTPSALLAMKELLEPLSKALVALMPAGNDVEWSEQVQKNDKEGTFFRQEKTTAVDPKLAELRVDQKKGAIKDLLQALTSNVSQIVLAKLLMNSMRDEGFSKEPTDHEALDFMNKGTDTDTLVDMLEGLFEANKKMISPFLKRLPQEAKDVLRGVEKPSKPEPAMTSAPETTG